MEVFTLVSLFRTALMFFFAVLLERATSFISLTIDFAFSIFAAASSVGSSAAFSIATVTVDPVAASDIAFSSSCV